MIRKAIHTIIGSLLVGIGVNLCLIPLQLMDGGIIGIGLLGMYYFNWQPGFVMLIVSLPIYGMIFCFDRNLFYNSFHGLMICAFCMDVLNPLRQYGTMGMMGSAIVGGSLIGSGIGLMLAHDTNTGGTDLLAQFLAKRTNLSVAWLIFLIDGFIVLASLQVIGWQRVAFSLVTIFCVAVSTHLFIKISRPREKLLVIGSIAAFLTTKKE